MKTFLFFLTAVFVTSIGAAEPAPLGLTDQAGVDASPREMGDADRELSPEAIQRAHDRGITLYEKGDYADAYPHLLTAAQHGYTHSQARLGALYLYGYGVERSDLKGLAWLGTASRGSDDARIDENFQSVWDKVPESHTDRVLAQIDEFELRFGPSARPEPQEPFWDHSHPDDALASECVMARKAGSHIKQEVCDMSKVTPEFLDALEREVRFQDAIGTERKEIYEDPTVRAFDQYGLQL